MANVVESKDIEPGKDNAVKFLKGTFDVSGKTDGEAKMDWMVVLGIVAGVVVYLASTWR